MGGQGGSTQGAGAANGVGLPQDQSVGMGLRAQEIGIATPSTNPGTPDGPQFYFATQAGT